MENSKLRLYCKDICHKYKAHKSSNERSYYIKGHKRCIECETFLQWDGLKCPCCGRILRTKPHNTISKGKLRLKQAYLEGYLMKWFRNTKTAKIFLKLFGILTMSFISIYVLNKLRIAVRTFLNKHFFCIIYFISSQNKTHIFTCLTYIHFASTVSIRYVLLIFNTHKRVNPLHKYCIRGIKILSQYVIKSWRVIVDKYY